MAAVLGEQLVPIDKVIPYDQNGKLHPPQQIKLLADRIAKGFDSPIVVDENMVIIKGHGRLEALKYNGATEALVKIRPGLSDEDKRAERLADNEIAKLGTDAIDNLKVELSDLHSLDVDLGSLGFDEVRLDELEVDLTALDTDGGSGHAEGTEDDVPEVEDNVFGVKRGDIWLLGAYLECDACGVKAEYVKAKVDQVCGACGA